jgi:hypothetical protein
VIAAKLRRRAPCAFASALTVFLRLPLAHSQRKKIILWMILATGKFTFRNQELFEYFLAMQKVSD